MKYLLDTNICVHFLRGKFNLIEKMESAGIDNCAISEITLAELLFGSQNSSDPKKNSKIVENFAEQISVLPITNVLHLYAKEKSRLKKIGNAISDFDLLIGCTSVKFDLIMVTENISGFKRITNIDTENWVSRN